jgi:hypothetical protein
MRYEKRSFKDETLALDGNEYIDCTFENCTMVYSGGSFTLEPFAFDGVHWRFAGPAGRGVEISQKLQAITVDRMPADHLVHIGSKFFKLTDNPKGVVGSEKGSAAEPSYFSFGKP